MLTDNETRNKITHTALALFLAQGIKKTSVAEIAEQSGLTRVTIYRYFENKRELVDAAFLHIITVFQDVQSAIYQAQTLNIEAALDDIERGLAALPNGDMPTRLVELKRLYPRLFVNFHKTRTAIVKKIFDRLFEAGRQQGQLREGLNQEVVQVYFMETVINLVASPQLVAQNLSPVDIYATVKSIFLHGILKEG